MGKICTVCGKSESEQVKFRKERLSCVSCGIKKSLKWYYDHLSPGDKQKRAQKSKENKRKRPWLSMFYNARDRAKNEGTPFSLKKSDIIMPEFCPVLGVKLFIGDGKFGPNSPTLDRVNNDLGYTKENVRVISWRANSLKKDATILELQCIIKYIKEHENHLKTFDSQTDLPYDNNMNPSDFDLFKWKFETACKQEFLTVDKKGEQNLLVGHEVWNSLENLEKTGAKFDKRFEYEWKALKGLLSRREFMKHDLMLSLFLLCEGRGGELEDWKDNLEVDKNYLHNLTHKPANWY